MERFVLEAEYIRLDDLLKLTGCVQTGGMAKVLIQSGGVTLDGQVCTMRGKKLHPGDRFEFMGQSYLITIHAPV